MKNALISMVVMFLLAIYPGGGFWTLLSNLIGGGTSETYLYPIYGGIILLTGFVVGCTSVVLNEIKSLKEEIKSLKDQATAKE